MIDISRARREALSPRQGSNSQAWIEHVVRGGAQDSGLSSVAL